MLQKKIRFCKLNRTIPYVYLSPVVLITVLVLAFPIIYNIIISFFGWTLKSPEHPFVLFENYKAVLFDSSFPRVLINTLIWTFAAVFIEFVLGFALALFVDSLKKGGKFLRSIIIIPWVIPGVVTALMWKWMLQADVGIVNSLLMRLGVSSENILFLSSQNLALPAVIAINVWKSVPFWFLMLTAALQDKPVAQIESARLDGANWFQSVWFILLPHLRPVITSAGVLSTIWTLNYFDLIWVTTKGGPNNATSTLPVYIYRLAFEMNDFGRSAALAVITLLVICVTCIPYFKLLFQNYDEEGIL